MIRRILQTAICFFISAGVFFTSSAALGNSQSAISNAIAPPKTSSFASSKTSAPCIVVDKSERTLSVVNHGKVIKSYHVELGDGGMGDKKISGDHKTPEGTFYITQKSVLSPPDYYLGSRWMRLSYPNAEDARRGLDSDLISKSSRDAIISAIQAKTTPPQNTKLGGGVGIHGGSVPSFGKDWTWGCVGLTNGDAEDLYKRVEVGTSVIVQS